MSDTTPPHPPGGDREKAGPRTAPMALWRVAQAFLHTLHNLFGAPEDVAGRTALIGKAHGQLASWIRCAEAMLRSLLLIEAAAYPKPNTRPLLRPSRKRARRYAEFWPDRPEEWRVHFRVLERRRPRPPTPKHAGEAPALRKRVSREQRWSFEYTSKPTIVHDAWPLALRYEALIRVFNDPAPFARRLARHLHATPHRHAEALRAPPEAVHRIERFEEMREGAEAAWRERRSSG